MDSIPPKGSTFIDCSLSDFHIKFRNRRFEPECYCGCGLPFICNRQEMRINKEIQKLKVSPVKIQNKVLPVKIQNKVLPVKIREKGPDFPTDCYICIKCSREHYIGKKCTR